MESSEVVKIRVENIYPHPDNPRKDLGDVTELAESMKKHGVMQNLTVIPASALTADPEDQPDADKVSVISDFHALIGHRRLEAAKLAGLVEVPCQIRSKISRKEQVGIMLLENIQREDLNVIEEAKAYEKLIQRLGYTQEQLAHRVGKSREHITNLLRLLKLPEDVQEYVVSKQLSMGHVRALLGLKTEANMRKVAKQAIDQGLSVRKVEQIVKDTNNKKTIEKPKEDIYVKAAKEKLQEFFQTSVSISKNAISIHYENKEDLNRVLELLNLVEEE